MRRRILAAAAFSILAFSWAALYGQQSAPVRPGIGSGVADVRGTVAVSSLPPVTVTALPAVTIAPHDFIKVGTRYHVVWPNGDEEAVTPTEVSRSGWLRAGRGRWVNIDSARSVEVR